MRYQSFHFELFRSRTKIRASAAVLIMFDVRSLIVDTFTRALSKNQIVLTNNPILFLSPRLDTLIVLKQDLIFSLALFFVIMAEQLVIIVKKDDWLHFIDQFST